MEQINRSNVLIVDDELGPRESLRMILKPSVNVYMAENGNRALEIIKEASIDLVTLDLKMPGMTGNEVLKHIKTIDPSIEVIIITGYGTLESAVEAIKHNVSDYILKPFNVPDILSTVGKCLKRRELGSKMKDIIAEVEKYSNSPFRMHGEITHVLNQMDEFFAPAMGENHLEFVKVLATTLESKDPYTAGHSQRVCYYALLMADGLGLSQSDERDLQISAYLHDIGKVGITNKYIFKEGPLSNEEWANIKQHPLMGLDIVTALKLPFNVIAGIKHHHERIDGKGYPEGLKGAEIPPFARMICIADAFDAMTVGRPYKAAMSKNGAKLELKKCAGTQFDPELVEVFIKEIDENGRKIDTM